MEKIGIGESKETDFDIEKLLAISIFAAMGLFLRCTLTAVMEITVPINESECLALANGRNPVPLRTADQFPRIEIFVYAL